MMRVYEDKNCYYVKNNEQVYCVCYEKEYSSFKDNKFVCGVSYYLETMPKDVKEVLDERRDMIITAKEVEESFDVDSL